MFLHRGGVYSQVSGSLFDEIENPLSEVKLLPESMIFTQRLLWGEKGLMRTTKLFPLSKESREREIKIRRRMLTLIAFEDMFVWKPNGEMGRHTFYKNNEMAGYSAVIHALQLKGIDGHYGKQRKVIIFSFGAVSRGAIYALKAHGFRDITICIQRPDH